MMDTQGEHLPGRVQAASLREVQLFRELPRSTLTTVAARCQPLHLARGQIVFVEGARADAVFFVLTGHVKVVRETAEGLESILHVIQPGEILDGAGGWGEANYPATAIALEDASLLKLPASELTPLIAGHPDFAIAVIRMLRLRLREADARIHELQTEQVERRIGKVLLRLADATGTAVPGGIAIGPPLSRQHLAALAGTTLFTASRVMSAWERQGLTRTHRGRVLIVQPHALAKLAGELARRGATATGEPRDCPSSEPPESLPYS